MTIANPSTWRSSGIPIALALGLVAAAERPCSAGANAPDEAAFALPIDCRPGETCFLQNWIDLDPGPGSADPACGPLTYDGHDGLDFRVTMRAYRAGVAVLAPAAGIVTAVRDGEPDGVFAKHGGASVAGRECGNGIVLSHPGGLTSQLCHLTPGSVAVRKGDRVETGQRLGRVGMSGEAEFPHLHFGVRRNGAKIDPFFDRPIGETSCKDIGGTLPAGLWSAPLAYDPVAILDAGFLDHAPADVRHADEEPPAPGAPDAAALVGWVLIMAPRTGDEIGVEITNPDGTIFAEQHLIQSHDQAQFGFFAGRKRTAPRWPAGTYTLTAIVKRGDALAVRRTETLTVR